MAFDGKGRFLEIVVGKVLTGERSENGRPGSCLDPVAHGSVCLCEPDGKTSIRPQDNLHGCGLHSVLECILLTSREGLEVVF